VNHKQRYVDAAMHHIYMDEARFLRAIASEFALADLGISMEDYPNIAGVEQGALVFCTFNHALKVLPEPRRREAEKLHKEWINDLLRIVVRMRERGITFTMKNAQETFMSTPLKLAFPNWRKNKMLKRRLEGATSE